MSIPAPFPDNESARMAALQNYQILDTPSDSSFDDITSLASFVCGTPIAIMTLVDTDRQWFKAKVGLASCETSRNDAFCAHTILQSEILEVEDALLDPRFVNNPLVTGEPNIRFYAGAPLISPDGLKIGSLCVIDRKPRTLTVEQSDALRALARIVVTEMEFRRVSAQLAEAVVNIKTLSGLVPICSYCKVIRNDEGYWQEVEVFMKEKSDARFSHGICPCCMEKHFAELGIS